MSGKRLSRRQVLGGLAATAATVAIVPRHVLGGPGQTPPSDTLGGALVGCGGRGGGTFGGLGRNVRRLASCDVRYKGRADNKARYTDFRRVMDRQDIDVVAIATPPHWHALVSIAAMQSGKDVVCEKPFTRFIAEGRAVVEAEKRYGRIIQVGTYGRYGRVRDRNAILTHKIMTSGLLKKSPVVHIKGGWLKVKEWSGYVNPKPHPVPASLD